LNKDIKKIVAQEYEYQCGDGCCYDAGYHVYISNEEGVWVYENVWSVEEAILEHLGVEIEYIEAEHD